LERLGVFCGISLAVAIPISGIFRRSLGGSGPRMLTLRLLWLIGGGVEQSPVSYKIGNERLIKVLPGASGKLRSLLQKQGRLDNGALRVAVVGGGCSGLQYKMDLVDGPAHRDILVESAGVRVVIDPKSALFVSGSELDFSDDLQNGGFKVKNPNAVVTCSCGESFAA
jgi:iron-sulfur cluster assembly protein